MQRTLKLAQILSAIEDARAPAVKEAKASYPAIKSRGDVGTLGNVYYMAGKDFAKIKPGIERGASAYPFAKT